MKGGLPRRSAAARGPLPLALLLSLSVLAGCTSPNRGTWQGTFAGTVSGDVEFTINARGTELTGNMEGTTRDGAPFTAELEGQLRDSFFYAKLEGTGHAELRPVPFTGLMKGELGEGVASGTWEAELRFGGTKLKGTWEAEQVEEP